MNMGATSDVLTESRSAASVPRRCLWRTPLVVGLCCGLGYGMTTRLLALRLPGFLQLGQGFDVRPFPGTTLERLRRQFGVETQDIRGDLVLLELEDQNIKDPDDASQQDTPPVADVVELRSPGLDDGAQMNRVPVSDQPLDTVTTGTTPRSAPLPPEVLSPLEPSP